jgi:hypothetical protein
MQPLKWPDNFKWVLLWFMVNLEMSKNLAELVKICGDESLPMLVDGETLMS